jgi:dynein heavy chain
MNDESMFNIFYTILSNFSKNFSDSVQKIAKDSTWAAISVYNETLLGLLPTPAKSHYTFNLRDLSKIFQGLLMADKKTCNTDLTFARLWVHENRRVFQDRMINEEDTAWFDNLLKKQVEEKMKLPWDKVVPNPRLFFGDYMIPGADPKIYAEVTDLTKLVPTMEEYLVDYNAERKPTMNLVLFTDAVEHISRICRVIRQPSGNALLLGVGGSGRQSLTRIATYIADYDLFQVQIAKGYGKNEWKENLKTCLLKAGIKNMPVVLLITDTQIVFEGVSVLFTMYVMF